MRQGVDRYNGLGYYILMMTHTDTAKLFARSIPSNAIENRFARDRKCAPCKGTGKRGRGTCRTCNGHGDADLRHPRIRFNWGFHDAANEAKAGRARSVSFAGEHSITAVSYAFDWWYAAGYEYGLQATAEGSYAGDSEPAWQTFAGHCG